MVQGSRVGRPATCFFVLFCFSFCCSSPMYVCINCPGWGWVFHPLCLNPFPFLHSSPLSFKPLFLHTLTKCFIITFRSFSDLPHKTKSSAYKRPVISTLFSPLKNLHPPHPPFHHCIHIHIEEPRGHDKTLSHTTFNSGTLSPTFNSETLSHPLSFLHKLDY